MTDAVLGIDVSIDAAVLAKLHASEFLPEVWMSGRRDFRTAASALFATNMIWFARFRLGPARSKCLRLNRAGR